MRQPSSLPQGFLLLRSQPKSLLAAVFHLCLEGRTGLWRKLDGGGGVLDSKGYSLLFLVWSPS